MKIVTFRLWQQAWQEEKYGKKGSVGIKPDAVASVEPACDKRPELGEPTGACFINLKGREQGHLVQGTVEEVIAALNAAE